MKSMSVLSSMGSENTPKSMVGSRGAISGLDCWVGSPQSVVGSKSWVFASRGWAWAWRLKHEMSPAAAIRLRLNCCTSISPLIRSFGRSIGVSYKYGHVSAHGVVSSVSISSI